MNFRFREGTNDRLIFEEIFDRNVYKLPTAFSTSDIIIDIGAHIGFFTYAVMQRGAQCVHAVEAETENYMLAAEHLKEYIDQERVFLIWGAVWRSDRSGEILYHSGHSEQFDWQTGGTLVNTGGGSVTWQARGEAIPVLPFDRLILQATEGGQKRIRLLKIDCEGSEWPILLTSKTLHLVDEITGEFHEMGGEYDTLMPFCSIPGCEQFTVHELDRFFQKKNFDFSYSRPMQPDGLPSHLGMFTATHKRS
ncbi:MAG: FkbM family methyltransferase [Ktedonobacteraceae bacterium]|nr:FkbM family methyltransferase [Ktedonobacteraceae bacterium]